MATRRRKQNARNPKAASVHTSKLVPKSSRKDKSKPLSKKTVQTEPGKLRAGSAKTGVKPAAGGKKRGSASHLRRCDLERMVQERTAELRTHQIELEIQNEELRSAQLELEASRVKYADLYEFAPIGYFTFDGKGLIQEANVTAADQLGITKKQLLFKPFSLFIHGPEGKLVFSAHMKETRLTRQRHTCELRLRRINGAGFYAQLESIAVDNIDGRAGHIRASVTDITQLKRAEHVLKNANEELKKNVQARTHELKLAEEELVRLATALESAADAVVITDSVNGIIQYVNPAFEKMTGYAKKEVLGRDLHLLDSERHDRAFYQQLRETLGEEGFWTGRLVQKRKNGTMYEEECTYSVVKNSDGKIINYISIKRDVTEKARLESIAQSVDAMNNIGYVFAGVSHEIGTPINTIGMILDIIRKKLNMLPKEKIAEYLERALSQVSRVLYLLHNLKSFNMYESLQPSAINMSSFLEGFLSMVKEDFKKKGVSIEAVFEQDAKSVHVDPRALQHVLLNIFTNAFDALEGRDDPKIVLTVAPATEGLVKIRVADNGHGMEETRLKDLFKPFYTTKKNGTGLGLVIIKKMVVRMKGTIDMSSRLNEGTTVEICLPSLG